MSKKHPTAEELIAYSNDNLNDANEMNFIKGHLDNCDICFQLVTDYSIKGIDINKQQKILNELNKTIFEDSNEYRKVIDEMNSKMFIDTEDADNPVPDYDGVFKFDSFYANFKVIGIGDPGKNVINGFDKSSMKGVDFLSVNTDSPDLNSEELETFVSDADMVLIIAGMGGNTSTGTALQAAKVCFDLDKWTIGIVTLPFSFEGPERMKCARDCVDKLQYLCDTVITIPNQNIASMVPISLSISESFKYVDSIIRHTVKVITHINNKNNLVFLDLTDIMGVMKMSDTLIGMGVANGKERAVLAATQALYSPLLDNFSIKGANGILILIIGSQDMTLLEVDEATNIIFEEAGEDPKIAFGAVYDSTLKDEIRVSIIANGIDTSKLISETKPVIDPIHLKESTASDIIIDPNIFKRLADQNKDKGYNK